jgi:uncharacterized repeat protein (TIGR01451 family)
MCLLLGTAQAYAGYQPDLLVKLDSESDTAYLGAGVSPPLPLPSKSQAAFPGAPALYRVKLTNAGDQRDSFLIRGTGTGVGFTVSYADGVSDAAASPGGFPTADLAPGESLSFLVRVAPAALPLGVSYRVSIEAASQNDPAKLDQLKTETVSCSSSAALTLSAPPDGFGPPGRTINYPYLVTNVGNLPNSFTLALASPAGWSGAIYADDGVGGGIAGDAVRQAGENTVSTSTGVLAPGASYRFFVAVTVPPGSRDGAYADTQISATGTGASAADQVTTSAVSAAVSVGESVRNLTQGSAFAPTANALPGDTLEYRMAVTNSGSQPAGSVGISSALPASTAAVAPGPWIATSPAGEGSPCAAATCGWVRQAGGSIVAHLGAGATETAGGSLPPGQTLYVFFRVQVQ